MLKRIAFVAPVAVPSYDAIRRYSNVTSQSDAAEAAAPHQHAAPAALRADVPRVAEAPIKEWPAAPPSPQRLEEPQSTDDTWAARRQRQEDKVAEAKARLSEIVARRRECIREMQNAARQQRLALAEAARAKKEALAAQAQARKERAMQNVRDRRARQQQKVREAKERKRQQAAEAKERAAQRKAAAAEKAKELREAKAQQRAEHNFIAKLRKTQTSAWGLYCAERYFAEARRKELSSTVIKRLSAEFRSLGAEERAVFDGRAQQNSEERHAALERISGMRDTGRALFIREKRAAVARAVPGELKSAASRRKVAKRLQQLWLAMGEGREEYNAKAMENREQARRNLWELMHQSKN